jgi:hypothetical protein
MVKNSSVLAQQVASEGGLGSMESFILSSIRPLVDRSVDWNTLLSLVTKFPQVSFDVFPYVNNMRKSSYICILIVSPDTVEPV